MRFKYALAAISYSGVVIDEFLVAIQISKNPLLNYILDSVSYKKKVFFFKVSNCRRNGTSLIRLYCSKSKYRIFKALKLLKLAS